MVDRATEHLDPFLTKKVQDFLYPAGAVYKVELDNGKHEFQLRRGAETNQTILGLGPTFKAARESVNGMIRAKRAAEFMDKHADDYVREK